VSDARRLVPRTDVLLNDPELAHATKRLGRTLVKSAVAEAQSRCRSGEIEPSAVLEWALAALPDVATTLRPVINATGVVVHTNLGRAPLSAAAVEAIGYAAGTTDVELDLGTGRRGARGRGALGALAVAVPGAEEVLVVNNGAAALALTACALAAGREIVIARGELVEIGDGFRIPELLQASGAVLREVGTTNRVRLADYAAAVTDETALILKVHPSNFVVEGFTSSVPVAELATLSVPVVADIGSGLLEPHPRLPDEPDAAGALAGGAAIVTASGDKLLGGPQCGLVLGRADLVQRLRRHPLARAMRVDKLVLAALEATLTGPANPVRVALATEPDALFARAEGIARAVSVGDLTARAVRSTARVGGGGAPGVCLDSAAVALPEPFAKALRLGVPSVLGRVERDRLLLDLIAVAPQDDARLVAAVRQAAGAR
jgi:L-seryl-tRNA(Ser) seleniumtransferase